MQILKPSEVIADELQNACEAGNRTVGKFKTVIESMGDDPGEGLTGLDQLAARLGREQIPMRRKQGIMKPTKLAVLTALCYRGNPPPALLVRFDNYGVKTTEALAL